MSQAVSREPDMSNAGLLAPAPDDPAKAEELAQLSRKARAADAR